jgi:multidrug efflux pump subunit AcrB
VPASRNICCVDNDIAQQKGVTIENAMNTLSTLIGSNYETSFIKYDRQYKVMVQALPQYRALPEDILKLYVKNDRDEMVPFSAFMKMEKCMACQRSPGTICTMPLRSAVLGSRIQ